MATQQRTIDFLLEQAIGAGAIAAKPMFGESGVYVDGKTIASVCDDQLFVKSMVSGRAYAEPVSDAPPYPSPESQMLIPADRWHDAGWLGELLLVTAAELPAPKPREAEAGHVSNRGGRDPAVAIREGFKVSLERSLVHLDHWRT